MKKLLLALWAVLLVALSSFLLFKQGWRWVASIREAYVRRILSRMIESVTRVGLDESEFMHLGK